VCLDYQQDLEPIASEATRSAHDSRFLKKNKKINEQGEGQQKYEFYDWVEHICTLDVTSLVFSDEKAVLCPSVCLFVRL